MVHKFTRKQNAFCFFNKIIEQVKKLDFWSLLMRDGSFQIIVKHTYGSFEYFPFNSCWCFLLFLICGSVRNLWLEYLGLIIAEIIKLGGTEDGKDIFCQDTLMQRMLTKREHHIKKLNFNFCLVLRINFPHVIKQ